MPFSQHEQNPGLLLSEQLPIPVDELLKLIAKFSDKFQEQPQEYGCYTQCAAPQQGDIVTPDILKAIIDEVFNALEAQFAKNPIILTILHFVQAALPAILPAVLSSLKSKAVVP